MHEYCVLKSAQSVSMGNMISSLKAFFSALSMIYICGGMILVTNLRIIKNFYNLVGHKIGLRLHFLLNFVCHLILCYQTNLEQVLYGVQDFLITL